MKARKTSNKKRPRQVGSTTSRKRKLSLGFLHELIPKVLSTTGMLEEEGDCSRSASVLTSDGEGDAQLLDYVQDLSADDCCEVRELPGKGKGVVASIAIDLGTVILSEAPLFTLLASTPMPVSFADLDSLIAAQGLSPNVKISISQLANIYPTTSIHPAIGILKTNSLPVTMMGEDGKERKAGALFEITCRINHSCVPNAVARWEMHRGERGEMRVVAKKRIEKGEEITISYGVKTSKLKEQFGFDCDCEKCCHDASAADGAGGTSQAIGIDEGAICMQSAAVSSGCQ